MASKALSPDPGTWLQISSSGCYHPFTIITPPAIMSSFTILFISALTSPHIIIIVIMTFVCRDERRPDDAGSG